MSPSVQGPNSPNAGPAYAQRPSGTESESFNLESRGAGNLLIELWVAVRRNWLMVLGIWGLCVLGAVAYSVSLVPQYTATGVLQVSAKDGLGAGNPIADMLGSGQADVQTEVEIVKRRELVLSAARAMNLAVVDPDEPQRHSADLEITLQEQSPVKGQTQRLRESLDYAFVPEGRFAAATVAIEGLSEDTLRYEVINADESVQTYEKHYSRALHHDDVEIRFKKMPLTVGERVTIKIIHDGTLYENLVGEMSVSGLGPRHQPTNLVQIAFTSTSRRIARDFVQHLMERYLEQSLEWQALRASRSADFVHEQLEDVRQKLQERERLLQEFSEKEQVVGLDVQAKVTVEESAKLRAQIAEIDLKAQLIDMARSRLRQKIAAGQSAALTANFFEDPILLEAVGSLTAKELKRETSTATFREDHPGVATLDREIKKQKQEIGKLLRSAERNLIDQREEVKKAFDAIEKDIAAFPRKQLELARLTRDLEVSQRMYSFLLEKKQEAQIMKASTTTDKRIVDPAALPHRASKPNRAKIVAMGLVLGLVFGVALAYQMQFLKRRIESVDTIREVVDLPIYGTIPAVAEQLERIETQSGRRNHISPDELWKSSHGPVSEAFRSLRVNVGFIPKQKNRARIIQVTSSQAREGKSTVVSNLATALSKSGARVLVMDLDLRKPTQHRIWRIPRSPGYSDLMAKGCLLESLDDYIQEVGEHGVRVLPAGGRTPETLTVLMHQEFGDLLDRLSRDYDYILFDSPPIFVADTLVLSDHTDLFLLTARPGTVERTSLNVARSMMDRAKVSKGLVLNGVLKHHSDYYYYGGYGYGSKYGYYNDYSSRTYGIDAGEDS